MTLEEAIVISELQPVKLVEYASNSSMVIAGNKKPYHRLCICCIYTKADTMPQSLVNSDKQYLDAISLIAEEAGGWIEVEEYENPADVFFCIEVKDLEKHLQEA
jgi:hypothetical protein